MKKRHLFAKILPLFSLALLLGGCTTLDYVDEDYETVKTSNVQTDEMFNLRAVEKPLGDLSFKIGISETQLENALVMYIEIQNNSNSMYKFSLDDLIVKSPVGNVSFIPPSSYIEGYQSLEAANYAGTVNTSAMMGSFAAFQNQYQYRQSVTNTMTNVENRNQSAELVQLQKTVEGIREHSITSYKFIKAKTSAYYYLFLRKPEEYPIVVNYKELTYKFGGKRNVQE